MRQALLASVVLCAFPAFADGEAPSLPNSTILELKLGFYQPRVGDSPGATSDAYVQTFGNSPMLLGQVEVDHSFWHKYGYLGIGFSVGYGEKYAKALLADGSPSGESTGLIVLPIRLMAVYRYDVLAHLYHIPLVPYAELGGVCYPWWTNKGGSVEVVNGNKGSGFRFGWGFTLGLALELDFLNPTYAREAREDSGIYHFYLFGEFNDDFADNFGAKGINLGAAYFTFGIAFEF
ncbi:MAG: MXAN_2562 family outer membrane beta-barrel protein [Myxococcaceae bacterium]